jgi:hypothetical protein
MTTLKMLTNDSTRNSVSQKIAFQIQLLLWKRYKESTKTKWDLIKVILPAIMFFVLLILIYEVFSFFSPDGIEPFFVPLAFWIFMQRLVVQIMWEKSSRLQESMRMMGLSDVAYWTSYFISDGIILGFILSFLCTIFTVGGLFNEANFGEILGLLFMFCLSAVPFAFFITSFFDTPQTSGQATLGLLFGIFFYIFYNHCLNGLSLNFLLFSLYPIGLYVIYIVIFTVNAGTIPFKTSQTICCFIPPLALQIGSGSFLKSYDGISLGTICGIMVTYIQLHFFIFFFLLFFFLLFFLVCRHIYLQYSRVVFLSSMAIKSRCTKAILFCISI